jgi:hypothetical protein
MATVEYYDVVACRINVDILRCCGGQTRFHFVSRLRSSRPSSTWLAREDRRSLSQYIELALEAHIEAKKLEGKKPKARS